MHFKLDENIPVRLKDFLNSINHQASTVFEEMLSGKTDNELIGVCKKENFVLVTLDSDFSNIISYPINSHNGIIVLRPKSQGSDSVINLFKRLAALVDIKEAANSIIIVEKDRIKMRK